MGYGRQVGQVVVQGGEEGREVGVLLRTREAFMSLERETEGMAGCRGRLRERRMGAGGEKGLEGEVGGCGQGERVYHGEAEESWRLREMSPSIILSTLEFILSSYNNDSYSLAGYLPSLESSGISLSPAQSPHSSPRTWPTDWA